MTARQLITDVLQDLGVLGAGENLAPEDAQFVLRRMNQWIDALALEGTIVYFILRTVRALSANVATVTIGTGGTINIVRPDHLDAASLIIDNTASPVTEVPIRMLTDQEWQAVPQKDITNTLLQAIYYDRGWSAGLAIVHLYPVPSVSTTSLVVYSEQALTQFADLDTDYTFPPGYGEFIRTNLPKKIAGGYGKVLTQDQRAEATEARSRLKRSNIRPVERRLPAGTPGTSAGSYFDWRTGESR